MAWLILKILVAVAATLVIYWVGAGIIRSFATSPRPSDEAASLAPVDVRFECSVCGSQVTMTAAPDGEVPAAPRHCMEEMQLVADHRSQ